MYPLTIIHVKLFIMVYLISAKMFGKHVETVPYGEKSNSLNFVIKCFCVNCQQTLLNYLRPSK